MKNWRTTNQQQLEHLGDYCSLITSIRYEDGELTVKQRIPDTQEGYENGQKRIGFIVRAVNSHGHLVDALETIIAIICDRELCGHFTAEEIRETAESAISKANGEPIDSQANSDMGKS